MQLLLFLLLLIILLVLLARKKRRNKKEKKKRSGKRSSNSMADASVLARELKAYARSALLKILSADWPCKLCSMSTPNSTPGQFINQGLYNWHLIRKNWTATASGKAQIARRVIPIAPVSTIVSCLHSGKSFDCQVPLRIMITILDDERERDGLYG